MTASAWTEDLIDRLKTLWREGQTAERIADELKNGITRSAVLGKVYRMGLSKGRPERPRTRRGGAGRPRKISTQAAAAAQDTPRIIPPDTRPPPVAAPTRPSAGPDIVTVRAGQCRWPYGEPGYDMVLCGRPVARGAFCAGHAAIGYRAPPGGAASLLALAGLT